MNTHSQPISYKSVSCKQFVYICEYKNKLPISSPLKKHICFVLLRGMCFPLFLYKINDLCLLSSKLAIKFVNINKLFILFYQENITASELEIEKGPLRLPSEIYELQNFQLAHWKFSRLPTEFL